MIAEQDLLEAIAECQGQKNPTANTCIKLAAFYIIKREMFGDPGGYSYASDPHQNSDEIIINSDSAFAKVIAGKKQTDVWPVMDELMETLQNMQPRLFYMVMEKLK